MGDTTERPVDMEEINRELEQSGPKGGGRRM
jgi:dipeptidyl-peptidase 4